MDELQEPLRFKARKWGRNSYPAIEHAALSQRIEWNESKFQLEFAALVLQSHSEIIKLIVLSFPQNKKKLVTWATLSLVALYESLAQIIKKNGGLYHELATSIVKFKMPLHFALS